MVKTKPFHISKQLFVEAYRLVKSNAGAAGVDRVSLADFEKDLKDNLYKLWNRMSSGTYFPPPVKAVPIPKKSGGHRLLGIPTVSDRIAQMVVKLTFEPKVEKCFLQDSYGYRAHKSALDAIGVTRRRCWEYDWVLEFDIKGLFDHIDHELLMKAVRKHTESRYELLYIERWLKVPMQTEGGEEIERTRGTPQGGVISPVLSNLFLHYVFDSYMQRNHGDKPWCRYADDGLVHCETQEAAQDLLAELNRRFKECGLELHPDKTKIVYCKDGNRRGRYDRTEFDFLGYTFRPRKVKNRSTGQLFVSFTPAVSRAAMKAMRAKTRRLNWRNRTDLSLKEIAQRYNSVLRGWYGYYGHYQPSAMGPVWSHFNRTLVAWAMKKYKGMRVHKRKAGCFLKRVAKENSCLFVHWQYTEGSRFV